LPIVLSVIRMIDVMNVISHHVPRAACLRQ